MSIFYDFFDIVYGQGEYNSTQKLTQLKDGTPLISSRGTEQGIDGYFNIKSKYKHVISVPRTGTICHAFYQEKNCCITDNCLVMIPKKEFSVQEMIYFSLLIRKEKYKYVYGRQVTPDRLGNTSIPSKIPQWIIETSMVFSIPKKPFYKKNIQLSDRKWSSFLYDDLRLFDIKRGKGARKNDIVDNGNTPFITSIDDNNGLTGMVNFLATHNGNTITVNRNGSVGEAFYQPVGFCSTEDVHIFNPKFTLNPYVAMFLIVLIKKEKYRYNYGRKWGLERMNKTTIMLPVDGNNHPDWQFMEDYIKSLPYSKNLETSKATLS